MLDSISQLDYKLRFISVHNMYKITQKHIFEASNWFQWKQVQKKLLFRLHEVNELNFSLFSTFFCCISYKKHRNSTRSWKKIAKVSKTPFDIDRRNAKHCLMLVITLQYFTIFTEIYFIAVNLMNAS